MSVRVSIGFDDADGAWRHGGVVGALYAEEQSYEQPPEEYARQLAAALATAYSGTFATESEGPFFGQPSVIIRHAACKVGDAGYYDSLLGATFPNGITYWFVLKQTGDQYSVRRAAHAIRGALQPGRNL